MSSVMKPYRVDKGYTVIRIGWVREPIGYKPKSIRDPNFNPMKKPEKIFSDPKRFVDICLVDERISHEIRVWDDGSDEFNQVYADATLKGIEARQEVKE